MLSTLWKHLVGAGWWLRLRLTGQRCIVCGGLLVLHTPWRKWRCNRTPLPVQITEQGLAWLAASGHADADSTATVDLATARGNGKRSA
jgi:hypothetical protein